jgi:hypothetical protein
MFSCAGWQVAALVKARDALTEQVERARKETKEVGDKLQKSVLSLFCGCLSVSRAEVVLGCAGDSTQGRKRNCKRPAREGTYLSVCLAADGPSD